MEGERHEIGLNTIENQLASISMQYPKTASFNDQNQADNFVLSEESLSKNGEISNFDKYENQLSSNSPFNDDDQAKNYVIDEESLPRNGDNAESSNFENQSSSISIKQHETTLFNDEESLSKNGENAEISDLEGKIDGDFSEKTFCDQDQEEKIEPNSWRDSCEGEEGEGAVSPSSSGYVGGGSSGCASRASGFINDDESNHDIGINRNVTPCSRDGEWIPGKRHIDEDDASMSWRKRKKHYIVLSHSGKPIYSRYGDEHKLAGFSATLQAIISFVENGGDSVKLVRAGKHQVVFLVKGPMYLVCITCTEESYESLTGQLELLYDQMVLILTKSVTSCFEKDPKFDMTPLLGGTDAVFSSLIHSFSWNPATFLHAYTCLPLPYATRQAAGIVLQDVAESGVLFAILMCRNKVISLAAEKESLHPDDMLLLSNFVTSSESFRTSESFSPICLPRFNAMAFIYAYIHYFDVDTYLILLTTSSDNFYHLKDCRVRIETVLSKSNVLSEVQRSMLKGGMRVEDLPVDPASPSTTLYPQLGHPRRDTESQESIREALVEIGGPGGLWHFMYHSIYLDQFVASEFSLPLHNLKQRKKLLRAYQKLYVSMHEKDGGPHKTQFRRDGNYVLLCWVTEDFELYAAFDPLADKALAIKTCNRICHWVKDVENEIFFTGASSFSWYNASGQSYLFAA